ncbi:sodium:calcium antiporter [Mycobacterium sp. 852013-50091_SCH5140682]|uniref:calcium/sodium antiporter n=1 Tax=Mycobacterium sp. 852013-50091_SCH5140682 TaxID=1834109 RepID=UPI0007EA94FD|nr:calcium/sodium antiporter [Mycobacterium sp. 852013-50091_SCH5140682]OBC01091.1 sodium:calcium antiporter [Mycobacterium sp. 852013-50091_SCH5140682]
MAGDAAWFMAGLIALTVGAELMVRGSTNIAARLGISPILIGLTVVSIGTSLPELAIGITAAAEGSGELAVGNIAGTNVVNILFILGLSALLRPLAIETRTLRFDLPVMAGAAVLLWVLAVDGVLSRPDGAVLVCGAIAYSAALIRSSRSERSEVVTEYALAYPSGGGTEGDRIPRGRRAVLDPVMMVGGIVVIVVGAEWLVTGAVGMARGFGVSDALIGLTVVAIGTSAPELVTTIVSTVRGQRDVAIGNLMGSSVYNILLILGVTCLVPAHGLRLSSSLVWIDIPIMVAATLVCIPILITGRRLHRGEGAAMVAAYLAYLTVLLMTQT